MIPKHIDQIAESDIQALLTDQVREGRTIEYKSETYGNDDGQKRELLADVSSFANAGGGDLLIGIVDERGVPSAIPGVAVDNVDAEIRRLDNICRTGVDPRLPGIRIKPITGAFPKGPVLLVRIPPSFAAPHACTFKGEIFRFYTRNNAGKHQLDVGELRAAFAASEANASRLERFRTERLSRIIAGETPVPLESSSHFVLHVLPLQPFQLSAGIDEKMAQSLINGLLPMRGGGMDFRHNFDGYLTHDLVGGRAESYTQLFRSGAIEVLYSRLATVGGDSGTLWLHPAEVTRAVVNYLGRYLETLQMVVGVPFPVAVTASMVGVKGAAIYVPAHERRAFRPLPTIERDTLLLPDVIAETPKADAATLMRPIFDAMWNAGGYPRCLDYDENGHWKPRE